MASVLVPEAGIRNDNSGQLVAVINADTSAGTIDNTKVQGLVNLGTSAFSHYPLVVGTDLPSANESNYVANDNTGDLMTVLNDDTSATTLHNAKLGGPLVDSITGSDGITVTNPSGVGAADLSLVNVPNTSLAGPLVDSVTAGTGITVTGNPAGVGSPTVAVTTSAVGGVPIIRARAIETELTTTVATVVATYTPTATEGFWVTVFIRVITAATTVTVTVTFDDSAGTAQTLTLLPANSVAVGADALLSVFIVAGSAAAIDVNVTAAVANQVYASAIIAQV
ncbi:MAG: hypothetical protein ACYCT1_08425 [Steroidobacteraceae bacterium]